LERLGDGVAFVPVRPPGHHASGDRAMGFCLVNNVAVAAASRVARGQRVLIVDWDVHHGNGTQDIFWDDPDVLYVSTHQHPLYPGTGRPTEVGGTGAPGLTLNLPVPPGATGDVLRAAIDEVARPTIEEFALFLEGGYDLDALRASVEATLAALLDLPSHPPPPTVGGPGLTRLRDDHTERLRAIDRVHDEGAP